MKKKFLARVAAVTLSAAMVVSIAPTANLVNVSAAAAVKLNVTEKKDLEVGKKLVLKLVGSQKSKWVIKATSSSNKKVVKAGKKTKTKAAFLAVGEGSAKVNVRIANKANAKKTKLLKAKVTVVGKAEEQKPEETTEETPEKTEAKITSVTQTKADAVVVAFSAPLTSAAAGEFAIVRESGSDNTVIPVKAAMLDSADKTKVTLQTQIGMLDGKTYTVTYTPSGNAAGVLTGGFTATDNVVADLGLSVYNVTAGADEEVKIQTLSAKGIVLGEYAIDTATLAANKMELKVTPGNNSTAFVKGAKLHLENVGDTAILEVSYHTYNMAADGKETGAVTKKLTVTAVADATTMSNWGYTVATKAPSWNSAAYVQNRNVAIGASPKVYFNFVDSKGNDKTSGYSISSSDKSKLLLAEGEISGKTAGYDVKGVSTGIAYIVVKDKKGNVVTTLPINVVDEVSAAAMQLNDNNLKLSNGASAGDVKTVKFTVKDQYGDKLADASTATPKIECVSMPDGVKKADAENVTAVNPISGGVTLTGVGFKTKGRYVYKVSTVYKSKEVTAMLVVDVEEPSASSAASATYSVVLEGVEADNTVDLAVGEKTEGKKLTVKIQIKADGVLQSNGVPTTVSIKAADNTVLTSVGEETKDASQNNVYELSKVVGGAVEKKVKPGAYVVDATYKTTGGEIVNVPVTNLTIKDSQIQAKAEVKKTAAKDGSLTKTFSDSEYVTVEYDGVQLALGSDAPEYNPSKNVYKAKIVSFDADSVSGDVNKNNYVKSVKLQIKTADGGVVCQDVPVGVSFTGVSSK